MPVWWVSGAAGFLGRHALTQLAAIVEEVHEPDEATRLVALIRHEPPPGRWPAWIEFMPVELGDPDALHRLAEHASPDYVLHCAGRTLPASEDELRRDNFDATVNLLDALRRLDRPIRLVTAGSAAELGPVESADLPVAENYLCRPENAYGRIKWDVCRTVLSEASRIETMVARIFNPIGPGLSVEQAFGRFARLLLASAKDPLTLRVGNLESRRDFIDIRDVVWAMIALALGGSAQTVYHVGTGRSHSVADGLNVLIRLSGRAVRLEVDPSVENSRGPGDSRADIRRITDETGWEPRISWEKSLADLWKDAKPSPETTRT